MSSSETSPVEFPREFLHELRDDVVALRHKGDARYGVFADANAAIFVE
jgi:hypothetical protein